MITCKVVKDLFVSIELVCLENDGSFVDNLFCSSKSSDDTNVGSLELVLGASWSDAAKRESLYLLFPFLSGRMYCGSPL